MGYMHINNLYKNRTILSFSEVYAMEKIHGTSAHIKWKDGKITFFAGGAKHDEFVKLFNAEELNSVFGKHHSIFGLDATVYGEAYGGKLQGMSATYGKELKFVVFDVHIGGGWLSVPEAEMAAALLGLDFVHYDIAPTDAEFLNAMLNKPSYQAIKNGMTGPDRFGFTPPIGEGYVLRPMCECVDERGNRVIAKHKHPAFSEHKKVRDLTNEQMLLQKNADEIANDWVTEERLNHAIDKVCGAETPIIEMTGKIVQWMQDDVKREGEGEIEWSSAVARSVGRKAAVMFKKKVTQI